MNSRHILIALATLVAPVAGCDRAVPPPPPTQNTGADAVARAFFEALQREDWDAAYAALDADSRAKLDKKEFARRAEAAVSRLEFKPTSVAVAVSETGNDAAALATFRGITGTDMKTFRDGAALRRTAGAWGVVLRANFGAEK